MGFLSMEPFILRRNEFFTIDEWSRKNPGLVVGFTSKNGGFSEDHFSTMNLGWHVNDALDAVHSNRERLAELIGFPLRKWVGAEQTHDIHIERVMAKDAGKGSIVYRDSFKSTDGFFTKAKGVLLTLCYADCVPLYFLHEETGAVGIAHAGWKGTVGGIAIEMVRMFESEGMDIKGLHAIIGPSICKNCYVVDERVIVLVEKLLEENENKPYNQIEHHQYELDLKQLNKRLLLTAGIIEENIKVTNFCTSCHDEHFFSHRRDKGKTGRMMSFIGYKEDLQV